MQSQNSSVEKRYKTTVIVLAALGEKKTASIKEAVSKYRN